jgi:hypothetical protein
VWPQLPHRGEDRADRLVVDAVVEPAQGLGGHFGEGPEAAERGQREPVAQQPGEPHRHQLAAHRTPIRGRLVAVTVETVTFTPDQRIGFRLVRGPVPHVVETITLADTETGCRLDLGTDFAAAGGWWGRLVASRWQATVEATMRSVKTEAERQATRRR